MNGARVVPATGTRRPVSLSRTLRNQAMTDDNHPAARSGEQGSVVGFTWPSALVLAAAAWCFFHVYGPRREQAEYLDARLTEAKARVERLREERSRLSERVGALEAGDPESVREAIREQLRKAPRGEWLPPAP